mmetsp:Transcript_543/g.680  ORF Transcript_543/g.680 Transcript_543/m.680 type:complete len:494 (-) Transcript_543:1128-2609(-)
MLEAEVERNEGYKSSWCYCSFSTSFSRDAFMACFLAGAASGTVIGALNYGFGVFVPQWSESFPDWSRTEINVAFSISQIVSSLFAPVAGHLMDSHNQPLSVRRVVTASLIVIAVGFSVVSLTSHLGLLYFAYFLIGIGFSGAALLGPGKVVGLWFKGKKRGRIMGLVSSSNNIGGLVMTQISTSIIVTSNFRWAAGFFSMFITFLALIYFVLVKLPSETTALNEANGENENRETVAGSISNDDQNAACEDGKVAGTCDPNRESESKTAVSDNLSVWRVIKSRKFLFTTLGYFCAFWTYTGVLSNIIPAVVAEGFSAAEAANIQSAVALAGICSKLMCGLLSENIGARITLMLMMLIQAVTLLVFKFINESGSIWYWILCVIYGLSFGGVGALLPLSALEVFGPQSFSRFYGIQNMTFVISAFLAPSAAGISFDQTGSYKNAFLGAAGVFILGIASLFVSGGMELPAKSSNINESAATTPVDTVSKGHDIGTET